MINLEKLEVFEVVDVNNIVIYEALYFQDALDFIHKDTSLSINKKVVEGFGEDVVETDNCIMAGIRG